MIELHFSVTQLAFWIVIAIGFIFFAYLISTSDGGYDFATPLLAALTLAITLIIVMIYGGIYWW